jgi:hypothetical protein
MALVDTITALDDPRLMAILVALNAAIPLRDAYYFNAEMRGDVVTLTVALYGRSCYWLERPVSDLAAFAAAVRADTGVAA